MKPSSRKVVNRSPARTVRIINLRELLPHPVEAESKLEADYVLRAAFAPTTRDIIHQPFVLPVSPRGYTPDFLQVFETPEPRIVVEVKTEKNVASHAELFDRAAEFLAPKGYIFYVLTERHLRRKKIDERALLLRRYAKARFPVAECTKVSTTLAEYPCGLPIGSLTRIAQVSREAVIHMVACKILTSGPNLHVDDSAVVTLQHISQGNNADAFERWFDAEPWGSTASAQSRETQRNSQASQSSSES